jgi:hypothetical protein
MNDNHPDPANDNKPPAMRFFVPDGVGEPSENYDDYLKRLATKQEAIDAAKEERQQEQDQGPELGD